MRLPVLAVAIALALLCRPPSALGSAQPDPQQLKALSIEELMQIDVTLATRQPEPIRTTAAAVTVVTGEEIRRSGVTTLADALALAEGVHVARFNNGTWAISARGFNATSANKLLVMVDGRTEFSPLFSGAFWNMLDYALADVDRIEVVRGPGATLWGANAVNGVINIVTRHARDTQGGYVDLGAGTEDPVLATVRYGGTHGAAAYRLYAKYAHRDQQIFNTGEPSGDSRRRGQGGFRVDWARGGTDAWLFKGDVFESRDDMPGRPAGDFTGVALQAAWSRTWSETSRLGVQTYYRRESRSVPGQLTHHIDTADVDLQHAFQATPMHGLIWGAGARMNHDDTEAGSIGFVPTSRRYSVLSAFIQDDIALRPNRVHATVGLKLERNAFSGTEWQPNVRGRLEISPSQMLWGAVARAVRRPTRLDVDIRAFSPAGSLVAIGGGDTYRAETLLASEIGYRAQARRAVALDATVFLHRYDDLRSQELPAAGPPIVVGNTLEGRSSGLELAVTVEPRTWWRVRSSYTNLHVSIRRSSGSRDVGRGITEANDPRHQFAIRTSLDLPRGVELDAHLRRTSELPDPVVPGYAELSVRVGWRPSPRVEFAVVGQDLLHRHHAEFGAAAPQRVEFERSVRAHTTVRF